MEPGEPLMNERTTTWMRHVLTSAIALALPIPRATLGAPPPGDDPASRLDKAALMCHVADLLKEHGTDVEASIWLGGQSGVAWFERDATVTRPTASSIKTFFLVELF